MVQPVPDWDLNLAKAAASEHTEEAAKQLL